MIGGVNPPRVLSQSGISEMGFQTSPSLQSRSVNKDFKEPTRSPPNSESKGPSTSFPEGDPDVSVGPQLPRSLVPHLSLMGAEMFDISPETDDSVVYFTPPMRPSLESPDLESSFAKETPYVSPLLSSLPLQPTQAPVVSPSSTSPEPQFQEVIESEPIQTVEMSLDMGVDASADVDAYLKEFSSDMEKISLVSVDTLNGVRYRESDEHRESTVSISLLAPKPLKMLIYLCSMKISINLRTPRRMMSSPQSNSPSWFAQSPVHPCLLHSLKPISMHPLNKSSV